MKNITQITDKEIEIYSKERYLKVYEKLDMFYFKLHITADGYDVRNSKGKSIGEIDIIVNSVYRDIMAFVNDFDKKGVYDKFGETSIGFFYLPVHKTRKITYNNIEEKTFILSDWYMSRKSSHTVMDIIFFVGNEYNFIPGWGGEIGPYIGKIHLGEWFDKYDSEGDIALNMLKEMGFDDVSPVSKNPVTDIEGLVLRGKNCIYEVKVNDTKPYIEASSKLIYRDTLLESFIHTVPADKRNAILSSDKSYQDKIYDLFLEYVDKTDFFNTMWFEEDDFLPPIDGYMGDVAYDLIPPIVAMVCKKNPVYKNVLRILLVTFSGSPYDNKFKRFKVEDRAILTEILAKSQMNK